MVVSKGWGHEVRGSGWAPRKSRAQADWVREEEYLEEKAKGWIKHYGCRASKRERGYVCGWRMVFKVEEGGQ